MKKIIIIGTTGSGKSTLGKALSKKLGYKYIQLDQLFWKPNWGETPDDEFFEKIKTEVAGETWVLDGNYTRSNHLTWPQADTIIWLNMPFYLNLYQNISRSVKRAYNQEEIWPNTGNRESFSRMFSKDSIVLWLLKTYWKNIKKIEARISDPQYSHLKFIRLKSRKDVRDFLATI